MVNPILEFNFLNNKQIDILREYIDKELSMREAVVLDKNTMVNTEIIVLQKNIGRSVMHFNIHKMPEEIYSKAFWYAQSINPSAVPNTFMFARYSLEYGIPRLIPHKDNSNTDFTIDYQLRSNIEWPIVIENKEYMLKDNDALIFKSSDYSHWRTPMIFKEGDFIDMVFFHFVDYERKNDAKTPASVKGDYIFDYYKQTNELYQNDV
jgi:hypothetical protein